LCAPQTIYDLLVKNSGPLELREDPELGVQVAGLKHVPVSSPDDILVRRLLAAGHGKARLQSTWRPCLLRNSLCAFASTALPLAAHDACVLCCSACVGQIAGLVGCFAALHAKMLHVLTLHA